VGRQATHEPLVESHLGLLAVPAQSAWVLHFDVPVPPDPALPETPAVPPLDVPPVVAPVPPLLVPPLPAPPLVASTEASDVGRNSKSGTPQPTSNRADTHFDT